MQGSAGEFAERHVFRRAGRHITTDPIRRRSIRQVAIDQHISRRIAAFTRDKRPEHVEIGHGQRLGVIGLTHGVPVYGVRSVLWKKEKKQHRTTWLKGLYVVNSQWDYGDYYRDYGEQDATEKRNMSTNKKCEQVTLCSLSACWQHYVDYCINNIRLFEFHWLENSDLCHAFHNHWSEYNNGAIEQNCYYYSEIRWWGGGINDWNLIRSLWKILEKMSNRERKSGKFLAFFT